MVRVGVRVCRVCVKGIALAGIAVPETDGADLVLDGDGRVMLPAGAQLSDAVVQRLGAVYGGDIGDA